MKHKAQSKRRELPARRRRQIREDLLHAIISGRFMPGTQLPTRRELERQFAASTVTVQTALDQMARDGFVQARGRRGTFVTEHPPHLTRFALAFPHVERQGVRWNLFFQGLLNAVAELERKEHCIFQLYFGVDEEPEENTVRRRLTEDLLAHRLAGVILAREPHFLADSALMTSPAIARAVIASSAPGFPCAYPDLPGFMERALDHLIQRGRKRVAVIMAAVLKETYGLDASLEAAFAARHLPLPRYWKLRVPVFPPSAARHTAHLLMLPDRTERPDGLLITDDNVLEAVCGGLMDAGVLGDGQLEIVGMGNFPASGPMAWPLRRLGFDSRMILARCMRLIAMQRRGETPPPLTLIPPLFEDELPAEPQRRMSRCDVPA